MGRLEAPAFLPPFHRANQLMPSGPRHRLAPVILVWLVTSCSLAWASPLGDIVYSRQGGTQTVAPAYFPHWVHRLAYKCYACHDNLFPMRRGANPTMAAMVRGESCGACHNSKAAFGVDACHRCHVGQ